MITAKVLSKMDGAKVIDDGAQAGLNHLATLWACDSFTKKIWTTGGLVDYFVCFSSTSERGTSSSPA